MPTYPDAFTWTRPTHADYTEAPEEQVKKSELLSKIVTNRPKLAEHVQHWGLPKEKLFPLDSVGFVKAAADAFAGQVSNMTPPQRLVCARNICARAEELEVQGIESSLAYKYASSHLSPHFNAFIEMRKDASAHLADDELNKLIEVANFFQTKADVNDRVEGLDKVAHALESFDHKHGLAGHWDEWVPDPGYTTFGLTADPQENLELTAKVAGFEVREGDFDDVDWTQVEGKLPSEVIEGMKDASNKLAVFTSLPDPEKEIIYQGLFTG
jgi:hypothetical protein